MANNPTISQVAKINIDNNKNKSIDYYDLACEARNIKHFMGKATRANGKPSEEEVINAPYNYKDKAFEYKIDDPESKNTPKDVTFYFGNLANTKEATKKYALFFFNLQCSNPDEALPLYFFMLNNDNSEHYLVLEVPAKMIGNDKPIQLLISYILNHENLTLELRRVDDDNTSFPTDLSSYTLSNMRLTYNIF